MAVKGVERAEVPSREPDENIVSSGKHPKKG
jgi:hypothetical protein